MNNNYYQQNYYVYVNGIEGAKAYQVLPNQTTLLIDTENPYIYMKRANAMGQASFQCFKIEQVDESTIIKKTISQEDYMALLKRIEELEGKKDESTVQRSSNKQHE